MRKRSLLVLLNLLFALLPVSTTHASQYFTISGKVTQADGSPVKALRAEIYLSDSKVAAIDANGNYSFLAAESTSTRELLISISNYPSPGERNYLIANTVGMANFTTRILTNKDLTINFVLPKVIPITIQIADGKGQLIGNSALRIYSTGGKLTVGGIEWNATVFPTSDDLVSVGSGQYILWIYSISNYMIGDYSFDYSRGRSNLSTIVPKIPMDKIGTYKLCAPINMGDSKTTPSECYDEIQAQNNKTVAELEKIAADKAAEELKAAAELKAKQEADAKAAELKAKQEADAKAAAELKAKQEADAKAAAELKAKQEADAKAAALKKITIICVKGKLIRTVIALKPKCPTGYKLKK